ncbi:MAG: hypothetical protein IJT95_07330, partial [Abditibacteriota bacterium]|nr:hypothetical protein [Abditibacteriota bacterium]
MERISNSDMDLAIANRDLQGPGTLSFLWSADLHYQRKDNHVWGTTPERVDEVCRMASLAGVDFMTVAGDL